MPHHPSIFDVVLKRTPWDALDRAVAKHRATDCVRSLSFKSQVVAMVQAQLMGITSLRHLVAAQSSHAARLYHLGVQPVCRSSLADANRDRPAEVFTDLLSAMIPMAHRTLRADLRQAILLIDSTSLPLDERSADWARFSATACSAKLHVIYDPAADCPIYAAVSPGRVNDITAAHAMPIQPGATYVFDLGYYDYAWWAKLTAAGCRIVTRLKTNTQLSLTETRSTEPGSNILRDQIGRLPARQAANRRNPMSQPVRELHVRIETGRVLRVLTNDLDAPAHEIADLYERRWAIELFFRWVKQTLKITRFMGTSDNAVRVQICCALMAFLLLRLAQASQTAITQPLAFARLVRDNLMQLRPLNALLRPPQRRDYNPNQPTLFGT